MHNEDTDGEPDYYNLDADDIDELFRNRWRCLLSVDDAVAAYVSLLDELKLTNSTYMIITSDHGNMPSLSSIPSSVHLMYAILRSSQGYNLGQHRLPSCKLNVYDHGQCVRE